MVSYFYLKNKINFIFSESWKLWWIIVLARIFEWIDKTWHNSGWGD